MDESQEPQDESVNPEENPPEGTPPVDSGSEDHEASDPSGDDLTVNSDASNKPGGAASESELLKEETPDETMADASEPSDSSHADMSSIQMPNVSDEAARVDAPRAEFGPLTGQKTISEKQAGNISMLLDVKLPVAIELGRTRMSIGEVLELGSGSIIELDKLAGEPVDILVNGKPLAKGEVVVLDENFGVRITNLISQSERIERMNNE